MKKPLLLIALFFISACSTAPKVSEEKEEAAAPVVSNEGVTASASEPAKATLAPSATTPTPVVAPKEVQKTIANNLDEAIRSQSDERIFKAATQVLMQYPTDIKALNALALYNYKKGRFLSAKYLLNRAVQIQASSEIYNNLGIVNLALEENREALQAFRQAFSLNPQDGVTAANLGAIFVDQRDYNKAVVALETAYQKGLRDIRVLNNYAMALTGTGKGSQAQMIYEKALKEQSNNRDILFNYSILLIEVLKKYKEGSEALNRLKFVGASQEQRSRIKDLEIKVKIGLQ